MAQEKLSQETKNKISIGLKRAYKEGKRTFNIGDYWRGKKRAPFSEEHRNKLALGAKDRITPEIRELARAYWLTHHHTEESKLKISIAQRGSKGNNWNPNREEIMKNKRNDGEYKQWANSVKYRDRGFCRLQNENCLGYKIIHHILPWAQYPEERYNVNNGITLCQYHHPRRREDETKLIPTLQELVALKNQ